jgi:hypothetical protein
MTDPKVIVYLTAQDAFSTQLDAFKRKMGEVAGGMTFATSASSRWEEGLRRLAQQQKANTAAMAESTGKSGEFGSGLGKATNAAINLSGNILGLNNQVSNFAEGMLASMGIGGPVVAGALAGLAAVTAAVLYFTKTEREANKAYDDWLKSMRQNTPLAIVGAKVDVLQEKVDRLRQVAAGDVELFGFVKPETIRLLSEAGKQLASVRAQYDQLFESLRQQTFAKAVTDATSQALALFQANVADTMRQGADFLASPAQQWARFPKILGDVNSEIGTFRNLIASTKDPLERLQLEAKLKELIALRAELARVRAGSPFTVSVGGDATRQGATAAEQQAQVGRAGEGGLSLAMQGIGGTRGLSEYGEALQEELRQFFQETAELIQTEFAQTLGDAIGNAFEVAFRTGDPLKAIQAFGTAMLAGVGSIFVQLGQTYLKYGAIMKALAKLLPNPFTAGWAAAAIGVALIALGKALNAVAASAAGGSAGAGGGGGGGGGRGVGATQSTVARQQAGRMTLVVDENLAMNPLHPRSVEWVAKAFSEALGMDIIIVPKGAISQA